MSTIRDVARESGVSIATVSHVLNNTRFVLPETRQRVLDAIDKLSYRPNVLARSLVTQKTRTVGVVVADVTDPFFAAMLRGIEDRMADQGYSLFVCNTDERPEREARYLELLLQRRVDGLVLAPCTADQPLLAEFPRAGVPIVYVDRRPPEPLGPFVGIDDAAAGLSVARYLLRLGHRRIAMLAPATPLPSVSMRLEGYRRGLNEQKVAFDPSLVEKVGHGVEEATAGGRRLLALNPPPTAVVAGSQVLAQGLLVAMAERGFRCPDEVSVVCFGDHVWARLHTPSLTVLAAPLDALCAAVVQRLMAALGEPGAPTPGEEPAGKPASPPDGDALLPVQLVQRASCAAPSPDSFGLGGSRFPRLRLPTRR